MSSFVVNILEDFLGEPRKHSEEKGQIAFDCPACAGDKGLVNGDGKGNLEVNYNKGVFKCWSCKDLNDMSGTIPKLIKRYGNKSQLNQYKIIKPNNSYNYEDEIRYCTNIKLPESFRPLTINYDYDNAWCDAMKYLKCRGITQDIIDYYNIGYTTSGKYFLRVIIPSYDELGDLNYFSGRAFSWVKPKYMNYVDGNKTTIIFNEGKINWDAPVYLVEGPFDHIVTPNSIPILGKFLHELLLETLIEKAKAGIIIVLDPDAAYDSEHIYKQLFYTPIGNNIKIVELTKYDIAKIHEKYGRKGVINVLRTAHKISKFKYNNKNI